MPKRLKWGTIQTLQKLVEEYFETHQVPTIAGLCLHLGIRSDVWKHYVSERWRQKKGSEEYEKFRTERDEEEIFQDMNEISPNTYVIGEGTQSIEGDYVKSEVSRIFQMAKQRIDAFCSEAIFSSKNPAGAIYYSKAALGYRENDPDAGNTQPILPSINIVVLPPPEKPKQLKEILIDQLPQLEE